MLWQRWQGLGWTWFTLTRRQASRELSHCGWWGAATVCGSRLGSVPQANSRSPALRAPSAPLAHRAAQLRPSDLVTGHKVRVRGTSCRTAHLAAALVLGPLLAAGRTPSAWPQEYEVRRDQAAGRLVLRTAYYLVEHDLRRGGAIARIQLTHGRAPNLLLEPVGLQVRDAQGKLWTDLKDSQARLTQRKEPGAEWVVVEARLMDEQGQSSAWSVKTTYEYRWGYVKVRRELVGPDGGLAVREVCPFSTVLVASLSHYGYRQGMTEQEGGPAFDFGSNRWGKLNGQGPKARGVRSGFVPRSVMCVDPGVEGLEWFVGSDLWQWDLQVGGRRGQARFRLEPSLDPAGVAFEVAPWSSTNDAVKLPSPCVFEFRLAMPLLEGHAWGPWLHASFNRNRGQWVTPDQFKLWQARGIQTVHCHNDGDYYGDGLFWRDGAYPPYPDMDRYDQVIADCHQAGIRVATYFSNKELHSSTPEFQVHGRAWGRMNLGGQVRTNFFRGTNEFGVQMCLRSGWLKFFQHSVDRVLRHHALDGVYYDWNVGLHCWNRLHEGKTAKPAPAGHWDIDEVVELMEWTRRRVGPAGLIIVHNTTTPMFATENFADYVVANEWGYGKWTDPGPTPEELPLEWRLAGARPRGIISYGQLEPQAPRHLRRLFALNALLHDGATWPADEEAAQLARLLRPVGDPTTCRFADWRNAAVELAGSRCASAIYSRPTEAFVLLANLAAEPQSVRCRLRPERLPYPLPTLRSARILASSETSDATRPTGEVSLDADRLSRDGLPISLPATGALLLHLH